MQFLRKLFDTSKKDVENLMPMVERVNALEPEVSEQQSTRKAKPRR